MKLSVACDAYGCQRPATERFRRTNAPTGRTYKFCKYHSDKAMLGAGFRVHPAGWDGVKARELSRT